jgi:hypothetical protein
MLGAYTKVTIQDHSTSVDAALHIKYIVLEQRIFVATICCVTTVNILFIYFLQLLGAYAECR